MLRVYKKNKRGFLCAPILKFTEFQCKCDNPLCVFTFVHPELITRFERLRSAFGYGIIVTSGYRCQSHNAAVGGVQKSLHTLGMAIDISPMRPEPHLFDKLKNAAAANFDRVKFYDNFIHCQLVFEESPY